MGKNVTFSITDSNWKHGSLMELLSIAGHSAALWVITKMPIVWVAALRGTNIIFAALIGGYVLKEKFTLGHLQSQA